MKIQVVDLNPPQTLLSPLALRHASLLDGDLITSCMTLKPPHHPHQVDNFASIGLVFSCCFFPWNLFSMDHPDSKLKKKMSIRMGLHGRLGAYIDALCVRMNACEHALVLSHPHHNLSFKFIYYYQNQTEEYVELMFLEQRLITQRSSKYMWYHEHE
jgi:hypothetical protein